MSGKMIFLAFGIDSEAWLIIAAMKTFTTGANLPENGQQTTAEAAMRAASCFHDNDGKRSAKVGGQ